MKRRYIGLLVVELLAIVLLINGCYYNEINPCRLSKRVSAEFKTYNELSYYDKENGKTVQKIKIVEEDTFLLSYVTFEALDSSADSYEWTIGQDPRKWTDKKFTLLFKDDYVITESPISIKLKIKRKPDLSCFPDDPGVDSVTHKIYFLSNDQWPVYGKYFGSDSTNPSVRYAIEITNGILFGNVPGVVLKNLPNSCTTLNASLEEVTAFEFTIGEFDASQISGSPPCVFREYDKKVGYLKADRKTIVIEYEFTDQSGSDATLQERVFTGIRQ